MKVLTMESYLLDQNIRLIELMNENKFEVKVITTDAKVEIFLGEDKWGEATSDTSFIWSGPDKIGAIGLKSDLPKTEVQVA